MAQINIVQLKEAFEEDRLDPEFYRGIMPENKRLTYKKIADILNFIQYGISIDMNEEGEGYKIYRMNEIEDMFCSDEVSKFAKISEKEMKTFVLKNNDILFNRTNSFEFVGRTGIFKKFSEEPYIFASYLVRLRTNEEEILPEYLTAFLNCKYGIAEIRRRARISINQSNVSASELKKIKIPLATLKFQEKIRELFNKSFSNFMKSKKLYKETEKILLEEIGFLDYNLKNSISFEAKFKDLPNSKRIDAEYFQPRYRKIIKKIEDYNGGSDIVGNVLTIKDQNFIPKKDITYKYIELSNVAGNGWINDFMTEIGNNLPTRARRLIGKGDIIISSIEGSLSSCALITQDLDNSICSSGFYAINSKVINPETLLVLFKSSFMQELLKKGCSGTILTAIGKDEFNKIRIPLVKREIQEKIAEKIKEAFRLRKEAKALLEEAKEKVEEFILN